jgi:phosphoserine phosphatase RsbU/P
VRRAVLAVVPFFVCMALQVIAQQAHPRSTGEKPTSAHRSQTATVAPDEIVDATNLGSPIVLDRGWRVGISSDPAAARPDFDDSKWAVRNAQEAMPDIPGGDESDLSDNAKRRFAWFRLHLKLAENHGPEALLIELPVRQNATMTLGPSGPGLDVFVDGRQVRPEGPHGDAPIRYEEISRIYRLGVPPSETNVTLALRTLYIPVGSFAYTSFFSKRSLRLGNPEDLHRDWELWFLHNLLERLPRLVNGVLLSVLSLFLLALYFTQKGHIEYLWLALHEAIQAPIGFIDLAGSQAWIDQLWYVALVLQLVAISAYLYFEFLIAFLALPRRWYIKLLRYTAPILAGVGPTMLLLGGHGLLILISLILVYLGSFVWIIGWFLFVFITLISATLRRNFEAGLLLIPFLLSIVGIVEPILTGGLSESLGRPYHSPLSIQLGPIPIHFATIADFAGLLAIVLIIFVRFLRIEQDRERGKSELAAARSVQELMIPHERLETPGYEVDSVYKPATEVGGDFFHVQPTSDGGLLVVIGDVAGKGLKAAMNVSMLMGALRRITEKRPAKILESLNRVLVGSDSLTTCQTVWFGPDGELVISNAGHLPPYLNTQEIVLPGGLPLGAVPDVSYDEVSLYLHPGDRLLLLSDGVVEARQSTGELFGFERVHNLSSQSAFYIADAAKAFGQEDDITVLTVRRLATAVAA